jgi:hypothetical protein
MTLLLARRVFWAGRIDPLQVGAMRLDKASELIFRGFSYILARFFACAIVRMGEK